MKRNVFFSLAALNVALIAVNLLASPVSARANDTEVIGVIGDGQGYDCCKSSNGGGKFCCDQCCSGGENCDTDADCNV